MKTKMEILYDIKWAFDTVLMWPLSAEKEQEIANMIPTAIDGQIAIMGFGPPHEPCCIQAWLKGSVESHLGEWDEGEEVHLRFGLMPEIKYDLLPEFEGF